MADFLEHAFHHPLASAFGTFETCRRLRRCLFVGVNQKSPDQDQNDAFDPKRTCSQASGARHSIRDWRQAA
jgi:hypothetical protein